ncbi:Nitrate reductase [NADH] [Glycine soja]
MHDCTSDSTWIIVHGHVYDNTCLLKEHLCGIDSILINVGIDCTEEFDAIHSDKLRKLLEDFRIGELITSNIHRLQISGVAFRASIPSSVRMTIQNIKEITSNHSEEDVYAMLKECSMDPNEITQKLLLQGRDFDLESY